jgi:hypothetical protein
MRSLPSSTRRLDTASMLRNRCFHCMSQHCKGCIQNSDHGQLLSNCQVCRVQCQVTMGSHSDRKRRQDKESRQQRPHCQLLQTIPLHKHRCHCYYRNLKGSSDRQGMACTPLRSRCRTRKSYRQHKDRFQSQMYILQDNTRPQSTANMH